MWRIAKSSVRVSKRHLSGSPLTQWDHDVLICGGGVVGAALAADILLRTNGTCSVGLVEMSPPKPTVRTMAESPDVRVYALSPNSIHQLSRLGAWKYIDERSKPYSTMQVWEESGPGLLRFSSTDMGAPELGRICEDQTIQSAIYQAIKDNGHSMTTYYGYSVDDLKLPVSAVNPMGGAVASIQPKDVKQERKQLSARLIVGADGANSAVRRLSGISTWGWGYGAEAVVATVRLSGYDQPKPTSSEAAAPNTSDAAAESSQSAQQSRPLRNDTAWQKYLPTGPLALLPLWDGYASIVWSTSIADAKRLKALPEEQFLVELNAALQTPPATDKWSVFEKSDASASNFPPFLSNLFGATGGGAASPLKDVLGGNPFQLLQRVKKEVASVADVFMSAAQLGDPLQYPPSLVALCGPRVSFPLSFSQASAYTAPRCALVGDAAHSIHPQAGQGLNLGIQDALTLSDNIVRTLKTGGDIGNASMLKDYERERYVKNLGMMSLVDTINTVFKDSRGAYPASSNVRQAETSNNNESAGAYASSDGGADAGKGAESVDFGQSVRKNVAGALNFMPKTKQFLRSAGMLGIHQLGPVKNKIAKFAMGLDSNNAVPK